MAVGPNGGDAARVGYAIPRQVGSAVVRNRIRRRLRAALRPRLQELIGLDVVVGARREAATAPWPQLAAALDRALSGARSRLAAPGPPG